MVVRSIRLASAGRREELRALASRSQQVVLLAAVTGVTTGLIVAAFDRIVVDLLLDHLFRLDPWVLAIAPGMGLSAAYMARRVVGNRCSPSTADDYLLAFHRRAHTLGARAYVARTIAAGFTLGSGGPMGMEGPSMYSGAVVGWNVQHRLPRVFRDADRRVLLVAGAAAGVAAIFKAPATGAVFALEVPYRDDLARRMLLPALVASAAGYLVFVAVNGTSSLFPVDGTPAFAIRDLLGAVAVGVIAGIGARGFAWMLRHAKNVAAGPRPLLHTLAAGTALALMFAAGRALTG